MSRVSQNLPLAAARPVLFPRPWGGRWLPEVYASWLDISGTAVNELVGEAWLVSDHPECESPLETPSGWSGDTFTLRNWMELDAEWLLGSRARPTPNSRFPLLLKLIHATAWLSVQVHPDDEMARNLEEPDFGKTEMWTFIHAEPGARIIAGLRRDIPKENIIELIRRADRNIEQCLLSHHPRPGDSVLIPPGTLHAIGPGLFLAEIQQNSNITYRVYDWDRTDSRGCRRPLHPEKSLAAIRWDLPPPALTSGKFCYDAPGTVTTLGCSPYFCADRVQISKAASFVTRGESFHLLLSVGRALTVRTAEASLTARPAQAVIVSAGAKQYCVDGPAEFLRYYVP